MFIRRLAKCIFTFTKGEEKIFLVKNKRNYDRKNNCYFYKSSNNGPWSVLFFGTDEFALPSLKTLNEAYKQKSLLCCLEIVTAYKGTENAVIKYAKEQNITVHNWPPQVNKNDFDIGVVVSFGHLIPSKLIDSFQLGMINIHGSLLPRWRGAAPICHALMNGDTNTGVTVMKIMPKKFDIGPIIAQRKISIGPDETYLDLYDKLAYLGADLLIDTMNKLPDVLNHVQLQTEENVTYAPKITEKMSFVNWETMTAINVYNLQRGLFGIQPVRTIFNKQIIKLINIRPVSENIKVNCSQEKVPGLVIFDKKNKKLYVSCKENSWITVETVIIPNRSPQSASDFGSGFILNRKEKFCIFC